MDNQLLSISKIFTEKLYRIPDYQRGYAWGEKQLKDFWNDIIQLEKNKNHYVGVLTLEKVPLDISDKWADDNWIISSKNYEPFYVVDGQQRLTTTIILIQSITECVPKKETLNYSTIDEIRKRYIYDSKDGGVSRSYIFGYEKDNPSYEFLKRKIFLENSISGYQNEETVYTHNLIFAKEYFEKKLQSLQKEEIEDIFKKVTQQLLFNIYSMTADIDVFVAFEAMNNRGKPLSNLELLKNRLIYLSTKFADDENEKGLLRKAINDAWKAVYHYLGKNKDRPLSDDFFLTNHFIIYFMGELEALDEGVKKFRNLLAYATNMHSTFLLEQKFTLKNLLEKNQSGSPKLSVLDVYSYIEHLQKSVEIWFSLYNPTIVQSTSDEEKVLLERMYRLNMAVFSPLLLAIYLKKPAKVQRIRILGVIERFGFIAYLSNFRFATPTLWELTTLATKISHGLISINDVEKHIVDKTNEIVDDKDFLIDLTKKFANEGFYDWEGIRYFLFEYEMSLKNKSKTKRTKIDWQQFQVEQDDYVTIEHMYPQTKEDCWKNTFKKFTTKQKKKLCNSLGNLLPLSKPKNSSLQNDCFEMKMDSGKGHVGYRYGSYSENEVCKLKTWDADGIVDRGLTLLEFMEKRWAVKLGNRSEKVRLLGLDFMDKTIV